MVPENAPGPRALRGENGAPMFGSGNLGFRLDAAMKDAYQRTLENASGSFDETGTTFGGGTHSRAE